MKILISDDHSIVREGLKQIVKNINPDSIIDEAVEGVDALLKIENNEYDLVILDISMPGKSGLDILKTLNAKEKKVQILMLSIHPQEQYAVRAFKLGASGYLCKSSIYTELETAIKSILSNRKYISPAFAEKMIFGKSGDIIKTPHEKLSEREFQIMCMLAKGKTVKEIAVELCISDKTVSTHRTRLLSKMGITKNAELTSYALKNDLIE